MTKRYHNSPQLWLKVLYGLASHYLWEDDAGQTHHIQQGEGGEQALMFALGQHPALDWVAARLLPGERLFAYLDDIYAVCPPDRVRDVYNLLTQAL